MVISVDWRFGQRCAIWYNCGMMNEEQSMFAEMLGIKKQPSAKPLKVARCVTRQASGCDDMVDELDVQREVVEAMAIEKVEIEESYAALEVEKNALEQEKKILEERFAQLESDFAELKKELEFARAGNDELEEKLARMGRSLAAARRAAAESMGREYLGGMA